MGYFELDAPISVGIITTNRCNLKCKHCMNNSSMAESIELSTDEIKAIIQQSSEANVIFIEFNGGEFFVRDDVDEIIDFALNKNLKVVLTTNGTLISDKWIEKYKNKITLIRVSLDSHIESVHDGFRGVEGAFAKTTKTIQKLLDNDYKVTVLTTISKSKLSSFDDFIKYLSDLRVNGLHTTLLIPAGRGESLEDDVLSPQEHREFLLQYRKIKEEMRGKSKLQILEESPQSFFLNDEIINNDYYTKCGAAFTEIVIMNDGYVLPCASFVSVQDKYKTDDLNIRKHNLIEIYKNGTIMKNVRDTTLIVGKCSTCHYLKYCGGGCRASADIIKNNLFASDPMCWLSEE